MGLKNGKDDASEVNAQLSKHASEKANDEALGRIVDEILSSGKVLSRKTLCMALLGKLEACRSETEKRIYDSLIRKLLHR